MRALSLATIQVLTVLILSKQAQAHISLDVPRSRYYSAASAVADQTKLKQGPCGVSGDKRATAAAAITTYKPGETITVTWRETIQHPGSYRIAFDNDGQDFANPGEAQPNGVVVLADTIADKNGAGGLVYSQQVTLPNVQCANCTLQLIQVMTTAAPPYASGDLYFNCADLVLSSASGAGGSSGAGGTASTVSTPAGATGGTTAVLGAFGGATGSNPQTNVGTGGAGSGASGSVTQPSTSAVGGDANAQTTGGTSSNIPSGGGTTPASSGDIVADLGQEPGCGCHVISNSTSPYWGAVLGLFLGVQWRRRKRASASG